MHDHPPSSSTLTSLREWQARRILFGDGVAGWSGHPTYGAPHACEREVVAPEGQFYTREAHDAAIDLLQNEYGIFPIDTLYAGTHLSYMIHQSDMEMLKHRGLGTHKPGKLAQLTGTDLTAPVVRHGNDAIVRYQIRERLYQGGSEGWKEGWNLENKGVQRILSLPLADATRIMQGDFDLTRLRTDVQAIIKEDTGIEDVSVRMRNKQVRIAIPYRQYHRLQRVLDAKGPGMLDSNIVDLPQWVAREKQRAKAQESNERF